MRLTKYESNQVQAIREWKADEPSVVSKAFGVALSPVTWVINKLIPESAIMGVLDVSSSAANWLTDTRDILRDAGVSSVADLKHHDLEVSDTLADEVHNWAIGMASAEGGAAGATGLLGMAVDIPAVIVLALRTIHKIGICYGFEVKSKQDKDFVLGILAVSGANEMKEKVAALTALRTIEVAIAKQTWKHLGQIAATQKVGSQAGIIGIKNLARQLGINLTKRKALQAIPLIGAAVGASVNGWYVKEVGWAARHAFQERWLVENQKVIDI